MAKIRMGFVSNSSSSSFVIAVPEGMEPTFKNLHRELYNTDAEIEFPLEYGWHDNQVTSYNVVEAIRDKINQGVYDYETRSRVVDPIKDLTDFVQSDSSGSSDVYEGCRNPDGSIDWDKFDSMYERELEDVVKQIKHRFPAHDFYAVEFSDGDCTFECEVEHGPALRGLPNVLRYSHH